MEVQLRDVPVQVVGQLEGPQVVDILVQGVGQVVLPQVVDVERPVQQQQQGMSFQVDTFILISFYRQTYRQLTGFYVGQVNAGVLHLLDLGVLCFKSCIL